MRRPLVQPSERDPLRLDVAQLDQRVHDLDPLAPQALSQIRCRVRCPRYRELVVYPLHLRLERVNRHRGAGALDGRTRGECRQDFLEDARAVAQLIDGDLAQIEADLEAAGAPWTPGRRIRVP